MGLSKFKFWRKFKGGSWYYVRPYDRLYSFQHVRYWTNQKPLYNEFVIIEEHY
jgi:hypothetical protein